MILLVILIINVSVSVLISQPNHGDVFREYKWSGFLRVGGDEDYGGDYIYHGRNIDLVEAIKIEVIIEKLQSHEGTTDLEIEKNDNGWIPVPLPDKIIKPQSTYLHHIYPVIPIPLSDLNQGFDNKFRMKVNPNQPWVGHKILYTVYILKFITILIKRHIQQGLFLQLIRVIF